MRIITEILRIKTVSRCYPKSLSCHVERSKTSQIDDKIIHRFTQGKKLLIKLPLGWGLVCFSLVLALASIIALFKINTIASAQNPPDSPSIRSAQDPSLIIHPALQRLILENPDAEPVKIIVQWQFDDRTTSLTDAESISQTKSTRRLQIISRLMAETEKQTAAMLSQLEQAERDGSARNIRSYWISPIISLEATPELIDVIAQWEQVVQIRLDEKIFLQDTDFLQEDAGAATFADPYNLTLINALLTEQSFGLDGSGIVVANLDTGVDWQHPALMTKYRGYNPKGPAVHYGNWYVATNEPYLYPGDGNGHGTHTMGTIVGDDAAGNRIGVAPGAKWIAVKVFTNDGYTYESWVHAAFEWVMAPEGNPALAPDVVNNSWGSDLSKDTRYQTDVATLRAAGILPVFSAGNAGAESGTISSPASYPQALAVGAIDENKIVATFSARGPSPWFEIKPEIVAPGVQVRSSFPGGGYAYANGTSMAAPHVTGVAALLLQARADLTPDELETLLIHTAEPLSATIPNNDTGWGLVDAYAAALYSTAQGELVGKVVKSNGDGIANASVVAIRRDEEVTVTVQSQSNGEYSTPIPPGLYDVTADAFGYNSETISGVSIFTDVQTRLNITLTTQPVGQVYGMITDEITGEPLSATLSVLNTPVQSQSNPETGAYSLSLPAGTYSIRINADSHRLGHITPTVIAGNNLQINAALTPGPNILLVDSGAWYYGSHIDFYEDALEALDYPYTLWSINQLSESNSRPTSNTLALYDIVLWSSPQDSPGYISAGGVISDYLASGGRFLVSGHDVAYWDGGGNTFPGIQAYLYHMMSSHFSDEGYMGEISGEGVLSSLTLTVNTPDSANQQMNPDAVFISDTVLAQPAFRWADRSIAAVTAGTCTPYKAAWLGFGLEGVGPRSARLATIQKFLDWFEAPPEAFGLQLKTGSHVLISNAGSQVSQIINLNTTGIQSDTYHIELLDGNWSTTFTLPDGSQVSPQGDITLQGCSHAVITATISIPDGLLRNSIEYFPIRISSHATPSISQTVTITVKTPSPILVVDDERWYNLQNRYTETLESLDIPYDVIETGGSNGPSSATLSNYPLTLWTTGYDWYLPLSGNDKTNLDTYLDQGGRLLLSSQDLLDVSGGDEFVRNRLGVEKSRLTITSTEVMALPDNILNIASIPWTLYFPYKNWSDGITPLIDNAAVMMDQQQLNVGVVHSDTNWRTSFYAFPLEALDNQARQTLLNHNLLWLSPFGESRLVAPVAALEDSQFPITLTLDLATPYPIIGASIKLPLLPETSLVSGSLSGPWSYNAISNTLVWNGNLSPDSPLTMGAMLELTDGIADGTELMLSTYYHDEKGLVVVNQTPVLVDAPWITLDKSVNLSEASPNSQLFYTITFTNAGVVNTAVDLNETIPAGLSLEPGYITTTLGSIITNGTGFTWQGDVLPNQEVVIYYKGSVNLRYGGATLITRTDLSYALNRRLAWANTLIPAKIYFPGVWGR